MPKEEVLTLYAILDSFDAAGDELENVLDTFELARSELETAMSDLFDEIEYVMEQIDSCQNLYHRKKKRHRIYFEPGASEITPEQDQTA